MGCNKITSLGTPTATTDAVTKAYCDSNSGGGGANTSLSNLSNVSVNTTLNMNNNNITNVNDLTVSDDLRVEGKTDLDGHIDLGNAPQDDCNMYAQLDFKNHSTSTTIQFSSLYTDGYIEIKVNGSTKRLYYGAG